METYISDIKVVGATGMDDGSDVNAALKRLLINEGYKTTTDRKEAIKDIIIKEGNLVSNTATFKEGDATYQLCPFDGSSDFKTSFGDLIWYGGEQSDYSYNYGIDERLLDLMLLKKA